MFVIVRILDREQDITQLADSLSGLAKETDCVFFLTKSRLDFESMEDDEVRSLVDTASHYLVGRPKTNQE